MRKFIFLIVIVGAIWAWRTGNLPGGKAQGSFDKSGKPMLLIFTFAGCGVVCETVLAELKTRKAPFEEMAFDPANSSDENMKWLSRLGGKNAAPFIVAGDSKMTGDSTAQLAGVLGENFGKSYLTSEERRYFREHFADDGKPRIVMYAASWCGYCAKLRKELQDGKIDFLEIDVEKSEERQQLTQTMYISGYPSTWVGYRKVDGTSASDVKRVVRELK